MSVIDQAKELATLIKKIGDIELYRKIVELEGEIIELTRSKHELEDIKQNLEAQLALKKTMSFKPPLYFQDGDDVPFCPRCWKKNNQLIHMAGYPANNPTSQECTVCLIRYDVRRSPSEGQGRVIGRHAVNR